MTFFFNNIKGKVPGYPWKFVYLPKCPWKFHIYQTTPISKKNTHYNVIIHSNLQALFTKIPLNLNLFNIMPLYMYLFWPIVPLLFFKIHHKSNDLWWFVWNKCRPKNHCWLYLLIEAGKCRDKKVLIKEDLNVREA